MSVLPVNFYTCKMEMGISPLQCIGWTRELYVNLLRRVRSPGRLEPLLISCVITHWMRRKETSSRLTWMLRNTSSLGLGTFRQRQQLVQVFFLPARPSGREFWGELCSTRRTQASACLAVSGGTSGAEEAPVAGRGGSCG